MVGTATINGSHQARTGLFVTTERLFPYSGDPKAKVVFEVGNPVAGEKGGEKVEASRSTLVIQGRSRLDQVGVCLGKSERLETMI